MRKFTQEDFTWIDSDLTVAHLTALGFERDCPPEQFEIEDLGVFTYYQAKGDTFCYTNSGDIFIAQIFNN